MWMILFRALAAAFFACVLAASLLAASLLAATTSGAQTLFKEPTLGFTQPNLPRVVPPPGPPSVVHTAPALRPHPLDANQCRLAAGTCPLGRLQRSGSLCFCVGSGGAVLQGRSEVRPQGANPSAQ